MVEVFAIAPEFGVADFVIILLAANSSYQTWCVLYLFQSCINRDVAMSHLEVQGNTHSGRPAGLVLIQIGLEIILSFY